MKSEEEPDSKALSLERGLIYATQYYELKKFIIKNALIMWPRLIEPIKPAKLTPLKSASNGPKGIFGPT